MQRFTYGSRTVSVHFLFAFSIKLIPIWPKTNVTLSLSRSYLFAALTLRASERVVVADGNSSAHHVSTPIIAVSVTNAMSGSDHVERVDDGPTACLQVHLLIISGRRE